MARKEIGIGIAGIGTVGAAVARLLMSNRERLAESAGASLAVRAVSGRDQSLPRSFDTSLVRWFDDPVALANAPGVDMVVELIGGAEGVAHDTVRAALNAKKPVVTANKPSLPPMGLNWQRLRSNQMSRLRLRLPLPAACRSSRRCAKGSLATTLVALSAF